MRIDIIIPVFNEEEVLPRLFARLGEVTASLGTDWRVLFVNDGSTDKSAELIRRARQSEERICLIELSRNFGHQAAIAAGLAHADADAVVMMDADLQDPPELLASFLDQWRQGYEVVYAIRRRRKENLLKRLAYAAFYRTLKAMAQIDIPLDAGDFCLLDARVVRTLNGMEERHRFLRGLRSWVGFRQIGIAYDRPQRQAGQTKYTLRKLVALALSGYVGFSTVPLRLATLLGLAAGVLGLVIAVWVVAAKLLGDPAPRGWASTLAPMLILAGVQLLVLGVIGEYLGKIYDEVRRRPLYIVRDTLGLKAAAGR